MTRTIGELLFDGGSTLIKMWSIDIKAGARPFVRHSHTRFEITVVERGAGKYTTQDAVYDMRAGDVFVFSSNEVHCITDVAPEGLTIINLHVEPVYLRGQGREDFAHLCFSHAPDFESRIPAQRAAAIRDAHAGISREFSGREAAYESAIRSYLNLILIDLLRSHGYSSATVSERREGLSGILKVYDYIDEHLCEELTLAELAGVVGLSPNYFSHLFKRLNGISLWDYINAKRTEKAAKLIISSRGELTMLEIASRCGYNNTANFNKAFKKHKGITPGELRKDPKLLLH